MESYVKPSENFMLQNCLSPSRREGWTDEYGKLLRLNGNDEYGKLLSFNGNNLFVFCWC